MIDGTYRQKVEWDEFRSPLVLDKFYNRCKLWTSSMYRTCGSAALSLLTGISPKTVEKQLPKSSRHWSDRAIVNFLVQRHFKVIPLTKYGVTNLDPKNEWETNPISQNHVILTCALVCRNEASWFVITDSWVFHNFQAEILRPLFFVNKPSQSSYLITHNSWK